VTADQLRGHALGLAAEHGVRVHECAALGPEVENGWGPCSHVEGRVVDTVPIRDLVSYWIALHELGHIAAPASATTAPGGRLLAEVRAWVWAMEQSLVPWDAQARGFAQSMLESHVAEEGGVPDAALVEYLQMWLRVVGHAL
jgi:hypothetical protein